MKNDETVYKDFILYPPVGGSKHVVGMTIQDPEMILRSDSCVFQPCGDQGVSDIERKLALMAGRQSPITCVHYRFKDQAMRHLKEDILLIKTDYIFDQFERYVKNGHDNFMELFSLNDPNMQKVLHDYEFIPYHSTVTVDVEHDLKYQATFMFSFQIAARVRLSQHDLNYLKISTDFLETFENRFFTEYTNNVEGFKNNFTKYSYETWFRN